jgi:hypothetical protein
MAAKNPYNLDDGKRKEGPDRPVKVVTLTEEEQLAKLTGYVSVPKDFWPFVKYSTHVRYVETAGKGGAFRPGGFILNNPFDTKARGGPEKRFMKLQNGFNKSDRDYKAWIVAYEDIEYLYVKGTGVELTLQRELQMAVTALNANIARIAEYCKKLERRLAEQGGR